MTKSANRMNISYNSHHMATAKSFLVVLMCLLSLSAYAQLDRQYIRTGNRLYHVQAFDKAEAEYRKALTNNPANTQALYNLGCALMAQQQDSAAIQSFQQAGKAEQNKLRKSKAYHNMGWICQRHQRFADAIEAYKESLRNNPDDHQTRYNLALCQRQLKQQQQNQNQNQNEGNQQDEQQKPEKDQQQQQQQDPQQGTPQQDKMNKENAEQLLNAAIQQEKQTQERMKQQQPRSRNLQKQW